MRWRWGETIDEEPSANDQSHVSSIQSNGTHCSAIAADLPRHAGKNIRVERLIETEAKHSLGDLVEGLGMDMTN